MYIYVFQEECRTTSKCLRLFLILIPPIVSQGSLFIFGQTLYNEVSILLIHRLSIYSYVGQFQICEKIECVYQFKSLGMVVYRKSSWALLVLYLKQRPQKFIFAFLHRGDVLSFTQFRTVYFTYVHLCSFHYGIIIQGGAHAAVLEPLCAAAPPLPLPTKRSVVKIILKYIHFTPLKLI